MSKWTYDRFIEKESLLGDFYKNKTFLKKDDQVDTLLVNGGCGNGGQKRVSNGTGTGAGLSPDSEKRSYLVQQDLLRFVILHLFFITSTYFHYRVFATLVENCISLYTWMVL